MEVWKRGRTWPSRRSDIPAVPRGRFAFMPRGGDYSGFGLRGQERRKRFDLRAEVEPPSPSARVTHWGCGWEVDPERGLNQATGLGVGVEGVGSEAGKVWWGRPGEGAQPGSGGCKAAGLRPAPALHPLSPVPRNLSGLGATRSAASSGRRLRWRAWRYQRTSSGSTASLRKGTRRSQCAFCFGYREARLRPASPFPPGVSNAGAVGPPGAQGPGRAAADSGMRLVITFARPGRLPTPRFFARAEPSSCIWILSLLSPRGWRQHLFK